MAVNAGEITVAAEVNLENINGAAIELVSGQTQFFSERLHKMYCPAAELNHQRRIHFAIRPGEASKRRALDPQKISATTH